MPRLGDHESLLRAGDQARQRVKRTWDGFVEFALRDNVLEVAVALILGAAFTKLVTSFVSDIVLPIVALLPIFSRNLQEKFAVLKAGPSYSHGAGYQTVKQALDDGAVVMAYGAFINKIVDFLAVGFALYALAQLYGWTSGDSIIKHTVKCKFCRKSISEKANRCVNCTSWQDGRDEQL